MWRTKVFPEERRPALRADDAFEVILLARAGAGEALEAAARTHASAPFPGGIERARLKLIEGLAAKTSGSGIRALAENQNVAAVWVIPHDLFDVYVRIIQGIEYTVVTAPGPGLINLSLGPPSGMLPMPYREGEPINLATRRAAEAGKLTIVAAGNDGPKADSLNPWCLAPWVLCVGAAAVEGERVTLWAGSSRGRPGDSLYRPGVVAPGVDILTTHPPHLAKTAEMLAAEKRTKFDVRVPSEERASHTVVTGTSFAAPQVSAAAAQVIYFLQKAQEAVVSPVATSSNLTMAQIYTHFRLTDRDPWVQTERLAGTIEDAGGAVVAFYPLRPDPAVVKQILLDAAIPLPGYSTHEVGSGFITTEHIAALFGRYGLWDPELMHVKVTN